MTVLDPNPAGPPTPALLEPVAPDRYPADVRLRVWPALVIGVATILVGWIAYLIVWALLWGLYYAVELLGSGETPHWIAQDGGMAVYSLLFIIVSQGLLLLMAAGPAVLSKEPVRERLGFAGGSSTVNESIVFAMGSVFAWSIGSAAIWFIVDIPEDSFASVGHGLGTNSAVLLIALFLATALLPAIAEEALFRGYVQRRLLRRWPPWLAIAVSSVLFAAMHGDYYYALMVLPTGVWLGVVAWRMGTLWPAIASHFTINAIWFISARMSIAGHEDLARQFYWLVTLVSALALFVCLGLLIRGVEKKPGG